MGIASIIGIIKNRTMNLVREANKRGYKNGTIIMYRDWNEDVLGSGELKVLDNGNLIKYEYPEKERDCFDKEKFDTIYNKVDNKWVKIKE